MRSEKKQTAINLIAKIVSYGTTYLIAFFLTPYLVEKIGSEAYSYYPLANNFTSYMSIITIALNSMASRFITIALTKNEKENANKYFASIFFGNVLMSAILLIPMTIIVIFLDSILNIPVDLVISIKLLFSLVFIGWRDDSGRFKAVLKDGNLISSYTASITDGEEDTLLIDTEYKFSLQEFGILLTK